MKKQCINHPKYVYSGKESSPLGLGFAADPLPLGTIQEGRDNTNWIIAMKNGIKVWSRITRLSEIRDREKEEKQNTIVDGTSPKKKPTVTRKKTAIASTSKGDASLQEVNPNQDDVEDKQGEQEQTIPTKETAKRKPTNYNIYMKYKLKQLVKEDTNLKPKERIAHAVALWQNMTLDEKNQIVTEAKEALEKGEI